MTSAMTSAMIRARAVAIALLLAAAAVPAAAQQAAPAASPTASPIPTLKRSVTVSDDLVRIGDLFDNAGDAADTPIFRSPDAGTTGSVTLQQIIDAVRPYHLHRIDTQDFTAVEVTRSGRTIGPSEIEARIARTFAGRYGLGDAKDLRVTLDAMVQPIVVDSSPTTDLTLIGASLDPRSGRFEISFSLPGGRAMRRLPLRLTGIVVETVDTAVLTRALARGEVIKAADLTMERRSKGETSGERITDVDQAVGRAVRQAMRAGQPLLRAQLMKPELVHRDTSVTLVYEVPGIMITTRGKALEPGAMGDTITVANVETKRTVQGTVTGPNRVTIVATSARISPVAAAMPRAVASR
jgi:flagella basal body P-ring formation protein FlgA